MTARTVVVYVSHAGSGEVSVLRLDEAGGRLLPLQRLPIGGMLMPMALHPRQHRLYVARRSPPEAVLTLAIDSRDGRLAPIAEAPLPASMAYLSTDRRGAFLLSASYGSGLVAVSPIDGDGRAGAAIQVVPAGPNAHCIRVDAGNRFAWSTSLGSDRLHHWRFDATSGQLVANSPPTLTLRPGAGPRHLALHPNGRVAYLLNERDAGVDVLAIDAATGLLSLRQTVSSLPPGFIGEPWAADLQLRPDGRFLYVSERRASRITVLRVEDDDDDDGHQGLGGMLQPGPVGYLPVEAEPRGFAIDPGGRWLVVAGQASGRLGLHPIDEVSGLPGTPVTVAVGDGPNWVEMVSLTG